MDRYLLVAKLDRPSPPFIIIIDHVSPSLFYVLIVRQTERLVKKFAKIVIQKKNSKFFFSLSRFFFFFCSGEGRSGTRVLHALVLLAAWNERLALIRREADQQYTSTQYYKPYQYSSQKMTDEDG